MSTASSSSTNQKVVVFDFGAQYGQLLISRPDDPMVCHRAIEYLKERGLTVEEVRA